MKNLFLVSFTFLLSFMLTSCASTPLDVMKDLAVGMNKATVLDIAGDPDRTFRNSGKDYWIYKYYENNQLKEGKITIENGTVSYINLNNINERRSDPKSYKAYKKTVKENRKSFEKQFKNLDEE